VDLSTFIIAVFCLIDNRIEDRGLRTRGPLPKLSDAEVLTIEVVGEFLGMDTDEAIFRYFREHYGEWFPALRLIHRTTFSPDKPPTSGRSRSVSGKSFSSSRPSRPYLCHLRLSMPLPVCLFARAYRCWRFKGEAAFGKDILLKQRPSTASVCTYGFALARGDHSFFGGSSQRSRALPMVPEIAEFTSLE
jgi:hypothetical protein